MSDLGVAEDRTDALLIKQEIGDEEMRSGWATIADLALTATGWTEETDKDGTWDEETAKASAREALEAIGAIAYEPGVARTPTGRRSHAAKGGTGS